LLADALEKNRLTLYFLVCWLGGDSMRCALPVSYTQHIYHFGAVSWFSIMVQRVIVESKAVGMVLSQRSISGGKADGKN
jgi:hypothetical protein